MTKRALLLVLSAFVMLGTGCVFRSKKPKESPEIAAEVENSFRARWVEKRTSELVGQGAATTSARAQAEAEFAQKFNFSRPTR